jgi:glycine/D-amino acid oxidase-like deaminating enzyme
VLLDLPRSADAVIVGGGFAGMSTAWALHQRGITDVVVLEREPTLGRYASGRAAGLGRQLAEDDATTAFTVRGAQLLREQLASAWTPTGGVLTFDNLEHAAVYAERAARFGVRAEPLSRDLVLAHWPALAAVDIATALEIPSDGVIDVGALLALFAARVQLVFRAGATAIAPLPGGARIATPRGDIVARVVVDATGAWGGQLVGGAQLPSFKRHIYTLEAVPAAGAPFVWHLGACELYVRAAGDTTLVSPCDSLQVAAGDQQPDTDGEQKLRRVLAGSSLETALVATARACQRTFSESGTMLLGPDPDRPWLVNALALGGHGATASAAIGETVAAAVAKIL